MQTKFFTNIALLPALALILSANLAFAGPKITSPEPTYNFGTRPNTETVPHDFIIKNDGDAPLEISDVKTSCGCTVAKLEKKTLQPGEETVVTATLKLSGDGPRTKDISVFSNDPVNPNFTLKFEGSAMAAIKFEPQALNFNQIVDDEPKELKVKVFTELTDLTFNITEAVIDKDFLSATVNTLEAGKSYEISVKNIAPFPDGRLAAILTAKTDNPSAPEIRVYISGQVVGDYFVQPDAIRLRHDATPGKTMDAFVRISAGKIKTFNVVDAVKPVDSIDVQFEKQGDAYLIRLKNIPVDDESLNEKQIILKTDVEGAGEIAIPLIIMKAQATPVVNRSVLRQPVEPPQAAPAPIQVTPQTATPAPQK